MERLSSIGGIGGIHRVGPNVSVNRRVAQANRIDASSINSSLIRGDSLRTKSRRKEDLNDPAQIGASGMATEKVPVSEQA